MELVSTLLLILSAAAVVVYVVITEATDWIGRAEIIETRWPKLWRLMNNRPTRLILIVLALVMIGDATRDLKTGRESPEISFAPPKVALVEPTVALPQESPDSLRRRTIKLADDLQKYWATHPIPGFKESTPQNPVTPDEIAKKKQIEDYWAKLQVTYDTKYKDRVLGVIREYQGKGVSTGWLERAAENHMFGASPFNAPVCFQDELCQFRELAFHVDAQDHRVEF